MGMVGMGVPRENLCVVPPPCSRLSQRARQIRDNSGQVGHDIICPTRDQNLFNTTLHEMASMF
eukprot:7245644-Prorocentrum_lima.AAC.1